MFFLSCTLLECTDIARSRTMMFGFPAMGNWNEMIRYQLIEDTNKVQMTAGN